jgi:hypothetical protein
MGIPHDSADRASREAARACGFDRGPHEELKRPPSGGFFFAQQIFATSVHGTFRTWRDVRLASAFGGIAEVAFQSRQVSF